jgi:hypothetical protein
VTAALLATLLFAGACGGGDDDNADVAGPSAVDPGTLSGASSTTVIGEGVLTAPGEPGSPDAGGTATGSPTGPAGKPAAPSGASGPGSPSAPTEVGHGMTDDEIAIGIWYVPADSTAGTAVGVEAANEGVDGKGQAQAVVDFVNDNGGIAGRQIVPSWYELSSAEVVTPEGRVREAQRMCATWTEDAKVFAIVSGGVGYNEGIVECAAKAQTPYIVPSSQYLDEEWTARVNPYLYVLTGFTVERREQTMLSQLAARGFFDKGARVGLMIEGTSPAYKAGVDRALKPALEKLGVEVVSEVVYPDWISSPWPNYVLQFQQAGVTHVLFTASSGLYVPVMLFMRSADSQSYRPEYGGLGSDHLPSSLANNAPAAQLENAVATGWQPTSDLAEDPGPINARESQCREIQVAAGQPPRHGQAVAYCDALFFLRDALGAATALTPDGMASVVDGYGTSWMSAASWSTRFGRGRHDGVDVVRDLAFDGDCACFVYTGEIVRAQ